MPHFTSSQSEPYFRWYVNQRLDKNRVHNGRECLTNAIIHITIWYMHKNHFAYPPTRNPPPSLPNVFVFWHRFFYIMMISYALMYHKMTTEHMMWGMVELRICLPFSSEKREIEEFLMRGSDEENKELISLKWRILGVIRSKSWNFKFFLEIQDFYKKKLSSRIKLQ